MKPIRLRSSRWSCTQWTVPWSRWPGPLGPRPVAVLHHSPVMLSHSFFFVHHWCKRLVFGLRSSKSQLNAGWLCAASSTSRPPSSVFSLNNLLHRSQPLLDQWSPYHMLVHLNLIFTSLLTPHPTLWSYIVRPKNLSCPTTCLGNDSSHPLVPSFASSSLSFSAGQSWYWLILALYPGSLFYSRHAIKTTPPR
jgi:hypothetical protein